MVEKKLMFGCDALNFEFAPWSVPNKSLWVEMVIQTEDVNRNEDYYETGHELKEADALKLRDFLNTHYPTPTKEEK